MVGDRRPYLTCLVMIDHDNVEKYAQDHDIPFTNFASLCRAQAIRGAARGPGATTADLRAVMVKRVTFWRVLAEEQGRAVTMTDAMHPLLVGVPEDVVSSIADTLIENVLTHTQAGVDLRVGWQAEGDFATMRVEDSGPGFSAGFDPTTRGVSSRGSTGLGLDIARKTAEAAGGSLRWGRSQLGGALVEVSLPLFK